MLNHPVLNVLYAFVAIYGYGVIFAFQLEELMYRLRYENPCAYNHIEYRLGGEGLKGMLRRSCFSWLNVYDLCQLQAATIRKD
jgi:hypothetical protein